MLTKVLRQFSQNKTLVILLLLGTMSWSSVMFKSGLVYDFGMGFWGPNGHDGVWHIALANSLARGSFEMPIFSGEDIKNYHIGFDALLAFLTTESTIPLTNLYFQILPPILAFTIGFFTYKLLLILGSKNNALWGLFFTYFGGSFGWILTLAKEGVVSGESSFWSQQAISTLINPPFALSLVLLLCGFLTVENFLKKSDWRFFVLTAIFWGVVIEIKVYAGLLILAGLLTAALWSYITKRELKILALWGLTFVLSMSIFIPLNSGAGGLIVWQPFWFLETMMQLTDRVGWVKYGEAMVNYKNGGVIYKSIPAYLVAFMIFWFGNLGTRVIKEKYILKKLKNIKDLNLHEIIIFSIIIVGVTVPMFFLQKGTPWNTIQFLYYSLFFSGLIAGLALNKIKKIYAIILILLTIPTTVGTLMYVYLPKVPPSKISHQELSALEFLRNQPHGVVLTYPFDEKLAFGEAPRPLHKYVSTAYVSAFSNKSVYLEDEMNLDITNYEWRDRKQNIYSFLNSLDEKEVRDFLKSNNISYIYWLKGQRARLGETQLGIERIFENSEVDIYKVVK